MGLGGTTPTFLKRYWGGGGYSPPASYVSGYGKNFACVLFAHIWLSSPLPKILDPPLVHNYYNNIVCCL